MVQRNRYNILVIDDEIEYQNVLKLILSREGYNVQTCSNGNEALMIIETKVINLVITDLKMPVMDGVELIKKIKKNHEDVEAIVITAYGSIDSAVESMKYGASDYFVKSGEMEELLIKVDRLAKIQSLERKSAILIDNQYNKELFMESKNEQYLKLLDLSKRAAETGINVLLLGESGVGKEVIANYIHHYGSRKKDPFVAVNCQVFPEGVIESELFGHEKGSFTGAVEKRIGKFEQANYGTLFLDEIGDLPLSTQGKLLRAIETRQIERLGGNKIISLDLQLIAATNKELTGLIEQKKFREDLFYRINTFTLKIPPLRDRKEDLPALIKFFVEKFGVDLKKKIVKINDEVIDFLLNYNYPGNVRELKNIIERMIVLSHDGVITINEVFMPFSGISKKMSKDELDLSCDSSNSKKVSFENKSFKEARADFEKSFITGILKKNDGNVTKASDEMEISSRQLWNKISQYGIDVK